MYTLPRLPKDVNYWFKQFIQEGEGPAAALMHAVQRSYEAGKISAAVADRLEANVDEIIEARADYLLYHGEAV